MTTDIEMRKAMAHARHTLLGEGWRIGAVTAPWIFQLRRTETGPWLYAGLVVRREGNPPVAYQIPDQIDFIVDVERQGEWFASEVGISACSPKARAAVLLPAHGPIPSTGRAVDRMGL
jgi:hypothetical protein